jgi:hypothetical protein
MRFRSWLLGAALLLGAVPVALAPQAACAAEGPHAALVVDTGTGGSAYRFCVALDAPEVSGTELIELASEQYGLSYRLGYGGNAVCELAGVGSETDDCFDRYPDFWGYWHGDESGDWTWASSGPASTSVHDGDIEGWSWGRGNDAASHPPPPTVTFKAVCGYAPAPPDRDVGDGGSKPDPDDKEEAAPSSPGDAKGDGASETGGSTAPTEPDVAAAEDGGDDGDWNAAHQKKGLRHEVALPNSPKKALPDVSPSPSAAAALPASARMDESGPPLAGLVGLAIAAAFMGAAVVFVRRRTRTEH